MADQSPQPIADLPRRKPLRLAGHDYSIAGGYFVTICTHNRVCTFGRVSDGTMILNRFGAIINEEWFHTGDLRPHLRLDAFVIMPNHLHAILFIDYPMLGHRQPDEPPQDLSLIINGFKSACTHRIRELRKAPNAVIWHRSFNDQIIRNDRHLYHLREYIANNPRRWTDDSEFRKA